MSTTGWKSVSMYNTLEIYWSLSDYPAIIFTCNYICIIIRVKNISQEHKTRALTGQT